MSFWKKKDNLVITGFVVVFFIGLLSWSDLRWISAAISSTNSSMSGVDFPFIDQNQAEHTLSEFKGKPVIVSFWATWCPSCVKKMGSLDSFAKKFQEKGGEVLAISQDQGGISTIKSFYARRGYKNLPIYIESTGRLLNAFGARGLPTAIFIDAQGKEVGRIEGGLDWESSEFNNMITQYFGINLSQ
ncbi:MAG: TlpA family protein disulfide reductase [Alphaproteobacteria bacterium]|nr:TlpA family protein disulfide reductase [Alphaproteobacteria bacterium]